MPSSPNDIDDKKINEDRFERGLDIRKKVLGQTYVDAAIKNSNDFSKPLQHLVTEYCWGYIWSDETLSLQQRSIINLAMISALNRPHELKLHVKGALRNGLDERQIQAILLQVGVYCGVPAAVDSFRIAQEAIDEFYSESID